MTETSPLVYDWRGTIAWLDQNGNETERARLRGLLGRPRPDARVVRTLEARQNRDGAFPSDLVQGRPSSIDTTELVLRWMQDLNMLDGPLAQRAVTYLFTAQRPDGSWDEELATGTGFPKVFYLNYHLYRLYFPLLALAEYSKIQPNAADRL